MAQKRLLMEHAQCQKSPSEFPEILDIGPLEMNLFQWEAVIAPRMNSRYYHDGSWKLAICVPQTYPKMPPSVKFTLPIIHPNVNQTSGEVCLDILKPEAWSPAWNLRYVVEAVLLLLEEPEPDSPLNVDAANMYRSDLVAFESVVKYNMWKHKQLIDERKESGIRFSADRNTEGKFPGVEEIVRTNPIDAVTEAIRDVQLSRERATTRTPDVLLKELQNVGDQVTKQFIEKAEEISRYRDDLDPVKQNVAQAVTRQLEQVLALVLRHSK